jgi:hypothetical protein
VLLSDHLGEFLRTIFARQDGVAHEQEDTIIRDRTEDKLADAAFKTLLAKTAVQAIGWCVKLERDSGWVGAESGGDRKGVFLCN